MHELLVTASIIRVNEEGAKLEGNNVLDDSMSCVATSRLDAAAPRLGGGGLVRDVCTFVPS